MHKTKEISPLDLVAEKRKDVHTLYEWEFKFHTYISVYMHDKYNWDI